MSFSQTIKSLNFEDRPREKLLEKGVQSLSDTELLAILLGTGNKNESALRLAGRILEFNNFKLSDLSRLSVEELIQFKGVGKVKAIVLSAAFELSRRRKKESNKQPKISSAEDVNELLGQTLSELAHEEFWVIFLNRANLVIRKEKISQGGISGTVVDQRIIFKKALLYLASSIILVHNHPSGNLTPSSQDKKVTQKIKSAAQLLEINLLDHIIIAGNNYYSFANELEL